MTGASPLDQLAAGTVPVCRFFTVAFPPKSSHFYTSNTAECSGLQASSKDWTFEAEAFYVEQASAARNRRSAVDGVIWCRIARSNIA